MIIILPSPPLIIILPSPPPLPCAAVPFECCDSTQAVLVCQNCLWICSKLFKGVHLLTYNNHRFPPHWWMDMSYKYLEARRHYTMVWADINQNILGSWVKIHFNARYSSNQLHKPAVDRAMINFFPLGGGWLLKLKWATMVYAPQCSQRTRPVFRPGCIQDWDPLKPPEPCCIKPGLAWAVPANI